MPSHQTELIASIDGQEVFRSQLGIGEYVIGRDVRADIVIEANRISRKHARLRLGYTEWTIEDLGSSNGTWVGEQRVSEPAQIFPWQMVVLGNVDVELRRVASSKPDSTELHVQTINRLLPLEARSTKRFRVKGIVARGGNGLILEAEEKATRRQVAMKVLMDLTSEEGITRFIEEAQITAQLDYPGIVPIYELGVNELDRPFFTMKLVRGKSLRQVLDLMHDGDAKTIANFQWSELGRIMRRVCEVVAFAHTKNVVHRDLKPGNIMTGTHNEVFVMDWGIAKPLQYSRIPPAGMQQNADRSEVMSVRDNLPVSLTSPGIVLGTPVYMAPEQATGDSHRVGPAADIYALGALLYSIITLDLPFQGDTMNVLDAVAEGRFKPAAEVVAKRSQPHFPGGMVPEELCDISARAMALNPQDRYPNVEAMLAALRRFA